MTYQTVSLIWRDIPFTLNFDPLYFEAAEMAHIEIRCDRDLPITSTGYKSIFTPYDSAADIHSVSADMMDYLTETAASENWRPETQLSLF